MNGNFGRGFGRTLKSFLCMLSMHHQPNSSHRKFVKLSVFLFGTEAFIVGNYILYMMMANHFWNSENPTFLINWDDLSYVI